MAPVQNSSRSFRTKSKQYTSTFKMQFVVQKRLDPPPEMQLLEGLLLVALALAPSCRGQVEETCAAQGDQYKCVEEQEASKMSCTTERHCTGALGKGQIFCCRPHSINPVGCPDVECSKRKGWTCQPKHVASAWPKVCQYNQGLCGLLTNSLCGCCAPKYVECEDLGCKFKGKGYECKNATEAKEWPVPCHQSDRLCKKNCFIHNTGSRKYSPYNVDPSSPSPVDCQLQCQADPDCQAFNFVPATSSPSGCWLLKYPKTGETSSVSTIGWVTGPKNCGDCFCCPPYVNMTIKLCEDTGCKEQFDGQGICKDVEKANWSDLDADFDLAAGSRDNNNCKKFLTNPKKDCCRCLKKKSCLDVGCKEEFGGHGICVDKSKADVAHLKKTIDFFAGEKEGKCRNAFKEDCCSCFKKITAECRHERCESLKGTCVIEGEAPPPNHSKSFFCNKTLNCNCWVPKVHKCSIDIMCNNEMKGRCLASDHEKPAGYVKSNYSCKSPQGQDCHCYILDCKDSQCEGKCINTQYPYRPPGMVPNNYHCNGNKLCSCYVNEGRCQDEKCTQGLKGKCVKKPELPPAGFVPSDYNCRGIKECPCYVKRSECTLDDHCKDESGYAGTCGEAIAGYGKTTYNCHQNLDCPCYLPCRNRDCEKAGGRCVLKSDKPPAGYKEGKTWCSGEIIGCKCWIPTCMTTHSCRNAGGFCFNEKPAGGVAIKGKCPRRCRCYKVPIINWLNWINRT